VTVTMPQRVYFTVEQIKMIQGELALVPKAIMEPSTRNEFDRLLSVLKEEILAKNHITDQQTSALSSIQAAVMPAITERFELEKRLLDLEKKLGTAT
jgi:hypothetical protein